MRGAYFLLSGVVGIMVLIAGGILIFQSRKALPQFSMDGKTLLQKKIVMVIAFKDFRDEEYFVPKEILEKAGVKVKTASNKMGKALGADGGEVEIDYLIENLDPSDFDAVVFVGGPGTLSNLDNQNSYNLAKETVAKNKVLAAICVSPVILAKAGVLKGKKATVWSGPLDKEPIKILEDNGAIYTPEIVVIDGSIMTGNGPAAAGKFGAALVEILK